MTTGVNGTDAIEVSSVTDEGGTVRQLARPLEILVSKGPVYIRYSLIYLADVNSKPREVVGSTTLLGCASDSSELQSDATCGSQYYNKARVQYSEGFCCQCSLDQMLGIGSHQRGELQCNLFSGIFGDGASVHCLRWGPIWYSLFRVVTPTVESSVYVYSDSGLNLSLDATSPVASTSLDGVVNVTARLVGSFAWTRAPTDFGLSVYAATPNIAASNSNDIRITQTSPNDPFKFGLLVAQSQVDLSGRTCNKVGVSHAAFTNDQGSRCSGEIGDCLQNQLDDIWSASQPSDYLINQLCQSVGGSFVHNDGFRLSCELSETAADSPTQVLIELNAHDVAIVYNESEGVILNVTTTSEVVALVQRTIVTASVENTGDLNSEFLVSVQDCLPDGLTLPLSGSRLSIQGGENSSVEIKVEDSNMNGTVYGCSALLADADGNQLSLYPFSINVSSVVLDRGAQSSDGSSGDTNSTVTASTHMLDGGSCGGECSGFFSIMCFIGNSCWPDIGALLGSFGGAGIALFLMTKFGAWSWLWTAIKAALGCCCKSNTSKRRHSDAEFDHRYQDTGEYYHPYPPYPIYNECHTHGHPEIPPWPYRPHPFHVS